MSVNFANIRMLRALSRALDQEAEAVARVARIQPAAEAQSRLLRSLSSVCNEAAEALHDQDRKSFDVGVEP